MFDRERAELGRRRGMAIDRRGALRLGGLTMGAAGAAALLRAPGLAAQEAGADALEWDMALDGRTLRVVYADRQDPLALPMRGDTFVIYGSIYPAGTIDQGLTGPDQAGSLGAFICRGTYNVDIASGAIPHVMTTVLHMLGDGLSSTATGLENAVDGIVHEGFEGGYPVGRRAITGGMGRFAGLRGEVIQTYRGDNETLITLTPQIAIPAPNYTFTFLPTR